MYFLEVGCAEIEPIINLIKGVLKVIQILIPIALIIMGSVDLGKAVLSSDDKEIKQATSKLIKRAIAAVVIFFIPLLVNLVMNLVASSDDDSDADTTSWAQCWSGNY